MQTDEYGNQLETSHTQTNQWNDLAFSQTENEQAKLQPEAAQGETSKVETTKSGSVDEQRITYSNLRVRQLNTLRTATTPRDSKLEKTVNLPRDKRLGKPLPPSEEDLKLVVRTGAQVDPARVVPRPWVRFWARLIDGVVGALILSVPAFLTGFVYGISGVTSGREIGLFSAYALSLVAWLLYEPGMISLFGTTIGKSMFGIRLSNQRTGENLTFGESVRRCLWMLWYTGQILSVVPFIGWIAPIVGYLQQYQKLVRDRITSYDERVRVRYEH